MIAFTMGPQGEPEFLTISDIATMHVPGALVVMSGCETGAGIARAGAGLLGLSRAWQMAGAGAVLSTAWPVLDSTGEIFSTFYRHLRAVRAAEALRMSQIEMIQSGTWRSAPSYWAAYQLSAGGVQ
jgi:CHAT domain-containing protein